MPVVPVNLRSDLEQARLDSLVLIRALDQIGLGPQEIPQRKLRTLFELDADCAEALWALDQPASKVSRSAMLRDTKAALRKLPAARRALRGALTETNRTRLREMEDLIRSLLDPNEAYNGIPGRDPQSG
jgi:hypothetical protein